MDEATLGNKSRKAGVAKIPLIPLFAQTRQFVANKSRSFWKARQAGMKKIATGEADGIPPASP
jgi:hypothetical protein